VSATTQWVPWLAACVYGGWAGYSNFGESGASSWIAAAIVQGSFAFVATLLLTKCVVFLLQWRNGWLPSGAAYCLCSMVLLVVPIAMHLIAGTPNLMQSILPGAVIGHCYLGYLIFYADVHSSASR